MASTVQPTVGTIVVGSSNPCKINAVARALRAAYAGRDFEVVGVDVQSGVSSQPWGDIETRRGACHRAAAAAAEWSARTGRKPLFSLGIEGGCVEEVIETPDLNTAPITWTVSEQLTCFAFVAILEPSSARWGCARTSAFGLPRAVSNLVRGGMELGDADAVVFERDPGAKTRDGTVGLLTSGLVSRTSYYEQATVLALIPFLSAKYFVSVDDKMD